MLLDPLILTTFVYVCPKAELPAIFGKIPSSFAIAWLIKDMKDNRCFLRSDVSISKIVTSSIHVLHSRTFFKFR